MKKFLRGLILFFGISLIAFLFSPSYFQKALIHTTADIDDYKLFENRSIENGDYDSWKVSENIGNNKLNDKDRIYIESLDPVAFLVTKSNEIIFEEYWDGYNEDSYSNSFSMAKSIVSLLIGIAIDEGKIESLDQKVSEFIPEFNSNENHDLTIKALLSMSSGLNWDESYGNPFSPTTKAYYGNDIKPLIMELKVEEKPLNRFKYLSANTQVLAILLENATGMHLSEYASEKLWKKIGTKNPALWSLDKKNGLEKAYCCFNSNAKDFAKIGQLILNKGKWREKTVISEDFLKQALSPVKKLKDQNSKAVDFYGLHWWILNIDGIKIPFARGILGQYIFVIPEKDAVVVRLGHKRETTKTNHIPDDAYKYIRIALKML